MLRHLPMALIVLSVTATHSSAKWKEQYRHTPPAIQAWYRAQQNDNDEWCCDNADGHPYFGNYRLTEDGGVGSHCILTQRVFWRCETTHKIQSELREDSSCIATSQM